MPRRNMYSSEEPRLFDPENGCGLNYSKERCWIKL